MSSLVKTILSKVDNAFTFALDLLLFMLMFIALIPRPLNVVRARGYPGLDPEHPLPKSVDSKQA